MFAKPTTTKNVGFATLIARPLHLTCGSKIIAIAILFCFLPYSKADSSEYLLNLEFGSDTPIESDYLIQIHESESEVAAEITGIKNYSANPISADIFRLNHSKQELIVASRQGLTRGKFTIVVSSSSTATVTLFRKLNSESQSSVGEWKTIQSFQLQDFTSYEPIHFKDKSGTADQTWTLQLQKPSKFYLEGWPELSAFQIEETISAQVNVSEIPLSLGMPCIALEIHRVEDSKKIHEEIYPLDFNQSSQSGNATIELTLPSVSGVYEARFMLADQTDSLWTRITNPLQPNLKTTRSFVVTSTSDEAELQTIDWDVCQRIQPSMPFWLTPDWLIQSRVNLPIGLQLDTSKTSLFTFGEHLGEPTVMLTPRSSFESNINKTESPNQFYSLRIPSDGRTDLQVEIGATAHQPTRQFTIPANPIADLNGPWQTVTWMHDAVGDEKLTLTNPSDSSNFEFHSMVIESGRVDRRRQKYSNNSHRHSILRIRPWSWIESYSADFQDQVDESKWSDATIELYRLSLAIARLEAKALNRGFNTLLVPINQDHWTIFQTNSFANRHTANTHYEKYLNLILAMLDQTNLGLMLEFTPTLNFLNTTTKESDFEPQSVSENNTEESRESVADQPIHTMGVNTPDEGELDYATRMLVEATLQEVSKASTEHPSFVGLVINTEGVNNFFRIPHDRANQIPPAASDNQADDLDTSDVSKSSDHDAELAPWIDEWIQALQPLNQIPVFFIQQAGSNTVLKNAPFLFISNRNYDHSANLSRKLLLDNQISKTKKQSAVLFRNSDQSKTPAGTNITELDISTTIERQNPNWIFVDDQLVNKFFSAASANNLRSFNALPPQMLAELKPLDTSSATVRVWYFFRENYLHLLVVNLVPWESDIDVETLEPMTWKLTNDWNPDASNGISVTSLRPTRSRLTLSPGRSVVLRSTQAGQNSIRQWTNRVSGGPEIVKRIKQKITDIVENVGILNQPKDDSSILSNRGFEIKNDAGIVGWLHAQHPPGCVSIDSDIACEGGRSARLSTEVNNASRTWLMTEMFPPPKSGRLALGLAIRGIAAPGSNELQQVRVAIETSNHGEPYRVAKSLDIDDQGKWLSHEMVIELDGIDPDTFGPIRIAIDSLKPGTIWIDDVKLYTEFPTHAERSEIQRKVFLAVQGMQRGNLLPAGQLLNDFWIHRILIKELSHPEKGKANIQPAESTEPSVAERIKEWIPQSLRF
ncbi:MAG: hypothetical protein ISQ09_01665 [Rubripirellula sp.]|nr:hypothetical protein [Rubripirellula sp.]